MSKSLQWLLKFVALFLTLSSVAGFFHYGILYYILLGFTGTLCFLRPRSNISIGQSWILLFLMACGISILVNNIPVYFNSLNRYLVYVLILLVVSPLLTNNYICSIRSHIFFYSLDVLVILSVGSFFAYFIGINLFVRRGEVMDIGVGSFSGLMNHSMVLGPFSSISAIYLLSKFLLEKRKIQRCLLLCGVLACISASFFSASRIAVLAGLLGCVIVLFRCYKERLTKTIATILMVIIIGSVTFPIWGSVTDFVIAKQQQNEEMGGVLYSRERKITARILEFTSSPVCGIGFCSVDPRYDIVNYKNGQIEPGSSWLALASMTGLLGLFSFIPICVITLKKAWKIKDDTISSTLSAILVFYLIHLLAEGYIMAPRSFLNMFFWLLLGTIHSEYNCKSFSFH